MIQRFIKWYLRNKSKKYCKIIKHCYECPFCSGSGDCSVVSVELAFRRLNS